MLNLAIAKAQRLLLALPPEQAHEMSLRSLELGLHPRASGPDDPALLPGADCSPIAGQRDRFLLA